MPLAYTTLIFWIVGLQGGFFGYLLFCIPVIACAIASTAYGYAMSAVFESVATAALVSVPIDFICIVFSGIYINLSNLPLHLTWLRYISPFYYGTEAISILQWSNVDEISKYSFILYSIANSIRSHSERIGRRKNISSFDPRVEALVCNYDSQ